MCTQHIPSATGSSLSNSEEETKQVPDPPIQKFVGQGLETHNASNRIGRDYPDLDEDYNFEGDIALSRKASRQAIDYDNLIRQATNSSKPLPPMGCGRPYPRHLGTRDPYVVQFDGDNDPGHPKNWRLKTKIFYTATVGLSAFCVSIGSALFAEASKELMRVYHIGWTVATLGTSLFVFGFAAGPVLYGPLSELFGRKIILIPSSLGYTLFCFAVATAKDIQTIMLCRFFAGFIGAAPLVVAPAVMADMFGARTRGTAITLFAMVLFGGPMLAPILGGFTVKNTSLGWRWTSYFCGIVGALSFVMNIFCLEETHHPIILARRAEELRRRTGNWAIYAPHDEVTLSIGEIAENNVTRPLKMLFTEPILFLVTLYNAFIYGMLYLFLTAVPIIFTGKYGWSQGVGQLPYISMLLGTLSGGIIVIMFERRYNTVMDRNNGKAIPEERLPPMMIGGVTFTGGMFWLGWSGAFGNKVHWMVPTIGAFFVGNGLMLIFLPCFNYIIDCYLLYAASALAGNTFLRSAFGAAFPLFARQMFVNLKIQWASTLLGCLGAIMIPVPILFYLYGKRIRASSKYAFVLE
ncbi:hypothetical protein KGF57_003496 [Candida theae]|uniref:Major facilitator superfamily (MFS) profile domain-containing protein n=1 Tax=Candida theae TaxID=1198502 RepID=A0AAD5BDH0_9ASCO|nr:uncharacterized protein KGF57_003496 [Candida theae]KAI5956010.1 hypothetical protein KGF57_003496 [Candida theae]